MATNDTQNTGSTQVTGAIEAGYADLDSVRTSALSGLVTIRAAKLAMLKREIADAKLVKDTATVESLTPEVASQTLLITALTKETAESATPLPARSDTTSVVHGFVMTSQNGSLVPAANSTVEVYAAGSVGSGTPLAQATTDSSGYYSISVPAAAPGAPAAPQAVVVVMPAAGNVPLVQSMLPLAGNSLSYRQLVVQG